MKKLLIWASIGFLALIALFVFGSFYSFNPSAKMPKNFGLVFKYGVGAKNVLDTFEGKFTKDMVVDPSRTVDLKLSDKQRKRIYQKMVEIGFFNYPKVFKSPSNSFTEPHETYYFKVRAGDIIQEVMWDDTSGANSPEGFQLRELIRLVQEMIQDTPEYKKLPEARGAYL